MPSFKAVPIAFVFFLSASISSALAQAADPFPPGDGHDVVVQACTQCHAPDVITSSGKSREEWSATVSTMVGNGATVSDADFGKVVDYLAKSFPPK